MRSARSHLIPDLRMEQLWQIGAIAAPFTVGAATATFTGDTWWALRMGQLSVEAGRPVSDLVLAHTPTLGVVVNGQWLGQVLLYVLYAVVGDIGLRLICGLLATVTFWILFQASRASGASRRSAAMAVLVGTLLASSNVTLRAQLFAYPMFALSYVLMYRRPLHAHVLLALAPLFAVWANIHGSFVIGLGLVGLLSCAHVIEAARGPTPARELRRVIPVAALVVVGCIAATLVNPLGVHLYEYVYSLLGHPIVPWVEEWRPPTLRSPMGTALLFSCLLVAACLWRTRRTVGPREWLAVVVFGYLAWSSVRHVVWWGIVITPILALRLDSLRTRRAQEPITTETLPSVTRGRAAANFALAVLIVLVAATSALWRPALAARVEGAKVTFEYSPIGAAEHVAAMAPGRRLFHYQPWTGYVDWRLWPRHLPFLDGRIEVHMPSVWHDYLDVNAVEHDWQRRLDKYGVDVLILHKVEQRRLIDAAIDSGQWQPTYEDEFSTVLVRREGARRLD